MAIGDDKKLRKALSQEGVTVTGSVGLLLQAKKRGLIPSIREPLDSLLEQGLRLGEEVYRDALKQAGEQSGD